MFFCFVFEFVFKERREREKKGEGFFCFSGGGGGAVETTADDFAIGGQNSFFSSCCSCPLSLSLPLSPSEATYLLGQLAGEELVQLGVEDAVGDELFFIFYFSRW